MVQFHCAMIQHTKGNDASKKEEFSGAAVVP